MEEGDNKVTPNSEGGDDRTAEFVELYSRFYPRLQYYVMAILPSTSDASDVLQETSMVLWRKYSTFESGTNFFAWACKVARLQAFKYRDRKHRSRRFLDSVVMEQLAEEAISEPGTTELPLEALEQCLKKLSEEDRSLVRRRYQPGSSVKNLAAEIGRTANSLTKTLGRIRRSLMDCIERKMAQQMRD